jgi:hypothetical protein
MLFLGFLRLEDEDWPDIAHVDCRCPVPSEVRFKSQIILYGICSGKPGPGTSFSRVLRFYPASIIPLTLHSVAVLV